MVSWIEQNIFLKYTNKSLLCCRTTYHKYAERHVNESNTFIGHRLWVFSDVYLQSSIALSKTNFAMDRFSENTGRFEMPKSLTKFNI